MAELERKTLTLAEFQDACRAQAPSREYLVFRCPMCKTLQSAKDLIAAGAGADFDAVEQYIGFSCIGRFNGAPAPRKEPDGQPCNWTLGGLFQFHTCEILAEDGKKYPMFELATPEEAAAHRGKPMEVAHG